MKRLLTLLAVLACLPSAPAKELPNIVLIFGDDMGIDSVQAFNGKLGLETPHLDRLAREGMSFMDAHTTSAVCTPSRYGLLTGRYNWRSRLKKGIVGRWERPLIEDGRLTLPAMLREHGYHTHMIGKWHLGFHWPKKGGGVTESQAQVDFTGPITGGPNADGFDYWFGDDVPNSPPYAWRENDRLLGEITTTAKKLGLTSSVGVGDGPAVAGWRLDAVLPEYAARCAKFIREQADGKQPFFLYFPMPSPHTPIAPDKNWKGKSGISDYADFLLETDWAVGELLKALDESGQTKDTLVIFTTDNGTSPKAKFEELDAKGVHLNINWRGYKADAYEGGHRVPFIVRWPGVAMPGARSNEVISTVDVMATIAEVVGHKLPADAAEDSYSILSLLRGASPLVPLHEAVICHSISGHFAVRRGKWKALFCRGSGGWSAPRESVAAKQGLPPVQLFDLEADPKETKNLQAAHPEIVEELRGILQRYIADGRSTPGPKQPNHNGALHWINVPWPAGKPPAPAPAPKSVAPGPRRVLDVEKVPANGRVSVPTPAPSIVRAWIEGEDGGNPQFLRWEFNKDASEVHVVLPEGSAAKPARIHLLTAEESERQADGVIVLSALDATVVGAKAKLETHPGNHRIGFWADGSDYVSWKHDTKVHAGSYNVELVYSRAGKPGAKAAVTIGDATLPVDLRPTGSWYLYQVHPLGKIDLGPATSLQAQVKSTVQLGAVMNLKAILLHPTAP